MDTVDVVVCGAGYWGSNIIEDVYNSSLYNLKCVTDKDGNRLKDFIDKDVDTATNLEAIFEYANYNVDMVSTSNNSHFVGS